MKVWINKLTNRVVGYESDFPGGGPNLALVERDEIGGKRVFEVEAEAGETDADSAERNALAEKYTEKFGKAPHPAMRLDKLRAKVEE